MTDENQHTQSPYSRLNQELWTDEPKLTQKFFWGIIIGAGILIMVGIFLGTDLSEAIGIDDKDDRAATTETAISQEYQSATTYREEEHGPIYNFFYQLFAGINDGLQEGFNTAANSVAPTDSTFNEAAPYRPLYGPAEQPPQFNARTPELNVDFDISELIGESVYNENMNQIGTVLDVLVATSTGSAQRLIVTNTEMNKQVSMPYSDLLRRSDGSLMVTTERSSIAGKQDFDYQNIAENPGLISLRFLTGGKVLDFNENVVGAIETVSFENAAAEEIYFSIYLPDALFQDQIEFFHIPFQQVQIIKSPDGYNIQLNDNQTAWISQHLL